LYAYKKAFQGKSMNTFSDQAWFESCLNNQALLQRLKKIKLIVSDIDGSLTDGSLFYFPDIDQELKAFSVLDGYATAHAIKAGLHIALLTGKTGSILKQRAQRLGISDDLCLLGKSKDKIVHVQDLQKKCNVSKEETLLFGDDILDVEALDAVDLFVAPQSTLFYVRNVADLVVPLNAGYGAFRLLLDLILYVQKKHFAQETIEKALKKHT